MSTITLELAEDQIRLLEDEVRAGRFKSVGEVVGALVDREKTMREDRSKLEALKAAIAAADAGGLADGGIDDVFARVRVGSVSPSQQA